jgi:hypothetical protein
MRAVSAALSSVRSVRALPVLVRSVRALPVLPRSSAPSRLASTEAIVPATPLSKHIEQFVPTAVIFTLLISIASVSAYYNGELMSLKKEIQGTAATLKKEIEGTAATLKSDMAGTAGKLEERVAGILKEVDAKNTGTKDAVDAKIIGFKEAADLKVRFPSALDVRSRARAPDPLAHLPPPPPCSTRSSDGLVSVVAVSVVVAVLRALH